MIEAHAKFERFLVEVSFVCPVCGEKNIRNYSPDDVYSLLECLERDKCNKCGVELEIYESNEPVGEIVRCRDCKDYRKSDATCHSLQWGNWGKGIVAGPDGFCAWGERWLDEL